MASVARRVVDPDNLPGLMHPIMQRHHLHPKDLKRDKSNQVVPGRGEFYCPLCHYMWYSQYSWIQIDLFDQRVCYRWSMKCKQCLTLCKPTFSIPEMEKLIEKAVCLYKGEKYQNPYAGRGYMGMHYVKFDPHLAELCEKCGWGQTKCWVQWRNKNKQ